MLGSVAFETMVYCSISSDKDVDFSQFNNYERVAVLEEITNLIPGRTLFIGRAFNDIRDSKLQTSHLPEVAVYDT